jgi:hypothetical protein
LAILKIQVHRDRGKELADNGRFTLATNIEVYFCDPQSRGRAGRKLPSRKVRFCEGFRMTAHRDDSACTGAVVRKPPMKETALGERGAVPRALAHRGLTLAAAVICQHNFCVMVRTMPMVENSFCIMCNFKELRVAKIAHISASALCP